MSKRKAGPALDVLGRSRLSVVSTPVGQEVTEPLTAAAISA